MNCRLTTAPFLQFFTLKRAQSKRKKSDFFTQKVPKKVVKTGDPADTDIAPERSKREGYFSRPPKIKFQNTGKHTEVCHTHILLVKISKNPGRNGTERNGRNGQADFAHSNVKGASAKIYNTNINLVFAEQCKFA